MSDKKTISIKMDMTQELRDMLADLKKMDAESNNQLKTEVSLISAWTAEQIKNAAPYSPMPNQAAIVADTVRFNRDRVPNVTIGGARGRKASGGASAGELVIGNEFGAYPTSANGAFPNGGRRFPFRSESKGRGNKGYWIYPTLTRIQPEVSQRWWTAADKIFRHWQRFG